ncbi:MAG: hypothetical protein K0M45_03765 [Candidatus Paracaedibacteraceae bacterium]|nr:hypothetical protein [Candidatus Paracaedibacteraceae bacterium]
MNITSLKYNIAFLLVGSALISSAGATDGTLLSNGVPLNAKLPADIIDTLGTPDVLKEQDSLSTTQESFTAKGSENAPFLPYQAATPSLNNRGPQAPITLGMHRGTPKTQGLSNTLEDQSLSAENPEDNPFFPYQDIDSQLNDTHSKQDPVILAMPENTYISADLKKSNSPENELNGSPSPLAEESAFLPSQDIDGQLTHPEGIQDPVILAMPENTDVPQAFTKTLNLSQETINGRAPEESQEISLR